MHIFDILEAWWLSLSAIPDAARLSGGFERSPIDRENSSCSLNLRKEERELDLVVWKSGEAELLVRVVGGSIDQFHFDDMRNLANLATIFSRLNAFVVRDNSLKFK